MGVCVNLIDRRARILVPGRKDVRTDNTDTGTDAVLFTFFFSFFYQVLKPKVPVKRAVFHEITQEALVKAFEVGTN